MKIKLYSTHCPKCIVLQKKLDDKNIEYDLITDINEIKETGYLSAPILQIDEKFYGFGEAVQYINSLKGD